jgi:TIM-barrel protein
MAGITDGNFCRNIASHGFDMVTIGGYNADKKTMEAGHKIIARGRPEFDLNEFNLLKTIKKESEIIKNPWNGLVSVNLRSVSPEPIVEVSKLKEVDVVEVNAHCRQPELIDIGCGQAFLYKPERLYNFIRKIVKNAKSKVSVKIRANVEGVDTLEISKIIEDAKADYLHVDAMKPGYNRADYEIIKSIKENADVFLIGNNSIRDLKSAKSMLSAGANGISIARAAIGGLPFKLDLI